MALATNTHSRQVSMSGVQAGSFSVTEFVDDDIQLVLDLVESLVDVSDEMANPEGDGQYCRQKRPQEQGHGSVRIEFGPRVETKSPQFQVEASPGETQVPRRFGDVAGRPIESGLNELAFDLFNGRRQVRVRTKRP